MWFLPKMHFYERTRNHNRFSCLFVETLILLFPFFCLVCLLKHARWLRVKKFKLLIDFYDSVIPNFLFKKFLTQNRITTLIKYTIKKLLFTQLYNFTLFSTSDWNVLWFHFTNSIGKENVINIKYRSYGLRKEKCNYSLTLVVRILLCTS